MLHMVKNWRDHAPEALVHGISLKGLAGSNLLREAAELRPGCDLAAAEALTRGELVDGLVFPRHVEGDPKVVLLVATRLDHRSTPSLGELTTAVASLRAVLLEKGFRTVAVAAFADDLPREEVMRVLCAAFGDLEARVLLVMEH